MYVNVQLIHLGRGINEVVVQNEDGGHTVFIDEQLSDQGRKSAYRHALRHIEEDDFGRHGDVQEIETRARKNPERELRECQ